MVPKERERKKKGNYLSCVKPPFVMHAVCAGFLSATVSLETSSEKRCMRALMDTDGTTSVKDMTQLREQGRWHGRNEGCLHTNLLDVETTVQIANWGN